MVQAVYGGVTGLATVQIETSDGEYIRVGDILHFRRAHPPTLPVLERAERHTLDDCVVIRQRNIQPFRIAGRPMWTHYDEIVGAFEEMKRQGGRSHITPYPPDEVFAPVKVVVAERPEPLRSFITYEPAYPWRGRLGTLAPGTPLWLAYAAVAVINSSLGRSFYRGYPGASARRSSKHGLDKDALDSIPVARRGYEERQLLAVAELACQVSTLYEAERECRTTFRNQIADLEWHLEHAIPQLLGSPDVAGGEGPVESGERHAPAEQPPLEFPASDLLGRLPNLQPVQLLNPAQREDLLSLLERTDLSAREEEKRTKLKRLAFWEDAVGNALPRDLETGATARPR